MSCSFDLSEDQGSTTARRYAIEWENHHSAQRQGAAHPFKLHSSMLRPLTTRWKVLRSITGLWCVKCSAGLTAPRHKSTPRQAVELPENSLYRYSWLDDLVYDVKKGKCPVAFSADFLIFTPVDNAWKPTQYAFTRFCRTRVETHDCLI